MQPLIYKQRIQRWGFRKSMLASLMFHGVVIFGISFVVIQQPWEFNKEAIVNIKFADGEFDMQGSSLDGKEFIQQATQQAAMVSQDVNLQDESQFSVRRLESNSSLQSFETIYLNAWQRQVETAGYYEISRSRDVFKIICNGGIVFGHELKNFLRKLFSKFVTDTSLIFPCIY